MISGFFIMLFKIAAAARLLWRPVYATRDLHRMNKMFLQMRDMFQEQGLVSQHDVIEQHQVLVQLSHVTHMRHHGDAIFTAEEADSDEFADTPYPNGVYLYEP